MLVTERTYAKHMDELEHYPSLIADLETQGLRPYGGDRLCGIGLTGYDDAGDTPKAGERLYFPFRHGPGGNLPPDSLALLIRLMEKRRQIGFNYASFDSKFLWNEGHSEDIDVVDVMLGAHLCNENEGMGHFKLTSLAAKYVDPEAHYEEQQLQDRLTDNLLSKGDMWRLHPAMVEPYVCGEHGDLNLTQKLYEFYRTHIARQELTDVWSGVNYYGTVIALAEREGLPIDLDRVMEVKHEAERALMEQTIKIRGMAGYPINPGSPKQINAWLGVASSAEKELETMDDPRVEEILRFRKYQKAIGSYYKPFLAVSQPIGDGTAILRASLSLIGTISGRLSCSKPNVQSLPRDTAIYRVKYCIIAPPGHVLLSADYRQAEMILACHYGRETNMADILRRGANMHDVTSEELQIPRYAAKRINFSVIYGIGEETLADNLHIPIEQSGKYLRRYHGQYPGFKRLYYKAEAYAKRYGFIRLWTGRRRHYNCGDLTPTHKASSNLIQGGVAERLRKSQSEMHAQLRSYGIKQLLQVHDSAVMAVPEDLINEAPKMVREIMRDDQWSVPLDVDISIGKDLENMTDV